MSDYFLKLSLTAQNDLSAIYEEGFLNWGEIQADFYYDGIINHFNTLCENPYLYQNVDEIRQGYRRSVCGKHSVYYRVINDTVEIMGLVKRQNRYN
ncbi:type II toxin-antitoxin system RelE/ParE family toxin [uncultured Paraglaciecola sp.]|uniref:type II toxin-antitoxin system RelE/ParE family toxin n=1 Tax=uncultured Paraglaciecola sp. TaxID=1765024 RepID=UPI00262250C8|nr:type II toxin-antitoxin system RelE/ParE family toxin [uncultured Paraglaciecola sp.]